MLTKQPIAALPELAGEVVKRLWHVREKHCLKCNRTFTGFIGCERCDACTAEHLKFLKRRRGGASFENSDPAKEHREAFQMAKRWRPLTSNVFIHGDMGRGKTYLGKCMLSLVRDNYPLLQCDFLTALEFTELFRQPSFKREGTAFMYQSHVLMIDDLDKAPWGGNSLHWLWQIFDHRRVRQLSTIVTTNMDEGSLCNYFGEHTKNASLPAAILDRMRPLLYVRMIGDSLRKSEPTLQAAAGQRELEWEE